MFYPRINARAFFVFVTIRSLFRRRGDFFSPPVVCLCFGPLKCRLLSCHPNISHQLGGVSFLHELPPGFVSLEVTNRFFLFPSAEGPRQHIRTSFFSRSLIPSSPSPYTLRPRYCLPFCLPPLPSPPPLILLPYLRFLPTTTFFFFFLPTHPPPPKTKPQPPHSRPQPPELSLGAYSRPVRQPRFRCLFQF